MVMDFHTHLQAEALETYLKDRLPCLVNCMTVEEVQVALALRAQYPFVKVSIGCHPNHPELIEDLLPYYSDADVIGEIGLDNVWSQADLALQRPAFIRSLEEAQGLNKRVVLHTKGMEQEIAEIIKSYPLTYIVHWYSGDLEALRLLKALDTYFTIGPDVAFNRDQQRVLDEVGMDRLLVETDGLEAIRWTGSSAGISETLEGIIAYICHYKGLDRVSFMKSLSHNFAALTR